MAALDRSERVDRIERARRMVVALGLTAILLIVARIAWNVYDAKKVTKPITSVGGFVRYGGDGAGIFMGVEAAHNVYLSPNTTDDHLADIRLALEALPNLGHLSLMESRVTDEGLVHLTGLVQVRGIDLRETRVTPQGVAELEKRLPNCRIVAYFEHAECELDEDTRELD